MANNPPVQIQFRIDKIEETKYSIVSKSKGYVIPGDDCAVNLTTAIAFFPPDSITKMILDISYVDKRTNEELMTITSENSFFVLDFDKVFKAPASEQLLIPDGFLLNVIQISLGSARGMLVIRNKGTYLSDIILPVFDSLEILQRLKEAMGNVVQNK
jgi:hypothetical protein